MATISDIYQKEFFRTLGEMLSDVRQKKELDVSDISEITGFSKIKVRSIEAGREERLLNLQLKGLLSFCKALDKKLIIHLEDISS